jgi:hypothetical protein
MNSLARIRGRVIDAVGTSAVHALEDGAVVGVVLGLGLTFPPAALVLLAVVGVAPKRAGPIAVAKEVSDLVREDARRQESYLVASFVVGTGGGVALGLILRTVGALSGVAIPGL